MRWILGAMVYSLLGSYASVAMETTHEQRVENILRNLESTNMNVQYGAFAECRHLALPKYAQFIYYVSQKYRMHFRFKQEAMNLLDWLLAHGVNTQRLMDDDLYWRATTMDIRYELEKAGFDFVEPMPVQRWLYSHSQIEIDDRAAFGLPGTNIEFHMPHAGMARDEGKSVPKQDAKKQNLKPRIYENEFPALR